LLQSCLREPTMRCLWPGRRDTCLEAGARSRKPSIVRPAGRPGPAAWGVTRTYGVVKWVEEGRRCVWVGVCVCVCWGA
jgi:hypothetical protein